MRFQLPIRVRFRPLLALGFFVSMCVTANLFADSTPDKTPPGSKKNSPIIVGTPSDSFPYAYTSPDGRLAGFTVDLLDAVARVMRLNILRSGAAGIDVHRRFSEGEYDMLQTYSQTPQRDEYTDFSVPFLTLQGAIFVSKNGPVKKLSDLRGQKFAIIGRGSIGERFLRDQGLMIEAIYTSSSEEALDLIEKGTCAGSFLSQLTALSLIQRNGLHNVTVLGEPYSDYDIRHCFAVHKGNTLLLARLNEGLAILNRTGEFQKIYAHWFGKLETAQISRQLVLRYGSIVIIVIAGGLLAGMLYRRVLKRMIAAQTAELSAQKALLQALYDNIPMAVCLLERDAQGYRFLSINRQAEPWTGLQTGNVQGLYFHQIASPSEWIRELASMLSSNPVINRHVREERHLKDTGKRIIFTLVPMQARTEGVPRLCVLGEDVTERRTLDEEIGQSRRLRAIGELVGGIAHEFNNLLTPIVLKTGEIQLDWPNDPRLHAEVQLISDAAQRASELTRRLLTFGRRADDRVESVYLASIVSACLALLKLTVDRRITWENNIPANLPPLSFNPTDLNQVILNLVLNARDTLMEKLAGPHAGDWTPVIRVEAASLPASAIDRLEPGVPSRRQILGWQRLTVRDNGMGMSQAVRERIFEPFYTTKDVGHGTGLGLATVWHLVTEVSGRIEVDSNPGEGSAFHVYLPMFAAPAAPPATPTTQPQALPPQKGRIFLAEDDDMVATAVLSALRRSGHSVNHQANGAMAWSHIQNHLSDYDLIILDVNMPGLDGIELAQRIRGTQRYSGRMMIISGRLGSDDLSQLTEARVDRVLSKPFQISEFLAAVHDCLAAAPQS
ncbi:MAG: transporter substrate-binding domain-containing protein [Nibricoccus sp.]